jgi:transcriptional regulator GlxA family with amidase domain
MPSRSVSVVLFDGFEVLDVFGPIELFSKVRDLSVEMLGPGAGPVASAQGPRVLPDVGYTDAQPPDIVLVPGGTGTRTLVEDRAFLDWLTAFAGRANLVTSVCTGSALLAAAGLLDGYRATSNKRAFGWASSHGTSVTWVAQARWVRDRNRWTSSGVAAGMDMAAALIGDLYGAETATAATQQVELEVHRDAAWDPFAALYGL